MSCKKVCEFRKEKPRGGNIRLLKIKTGSDSPSPSDANFGYLLIFYAGSIFLRTGLGVAIIVQRINLGHERVFVNGHHHPGKLIIVED